MPPQTTPAKMGILEQNQDKLLREKANVPCNMRNDNTIKDTKISNRIH